MALIVENGSGVAGANSYVTPAYVSAYLAERNRADENGWSDPEGDEESAACIAGTDFVEQRFRASFGGVKAWADISTARSTWEPTANPLASETVTIGSQVYTFRAGSVSSAGDVLIGDTLSDSLDNLVAAVMATEGSEGDLFGAGTVANEDALATRLLDDLMLVFAVRSGTAGNGVPTSTTVTGATFNFAATVGGSNVIRPQPLSMPRAGLFDRDGVPLYGIPERFKWGVAEYVVRARGGVLAPDPTVDALGGSVVRLREKVGPLETETEYVPGSTASGSLPNYPAADRLLREFLRPGGVVR